MKQFIEKGKELRSRGNSYTHARKSTSGIQLKARKSSVLINDDQMANNHHPASGDRKVSNP